MPTPRRPRPLVRAALRPRLRPARPERGTATLELVAATLVAGVLVSASVFVLGGGTPARLAEQVCAVVAALDEGHGCGQPEPGSTEEPPGGGSGGTDPGEGGQGGQDGPVEHATDPKPEKCKKKEHEEDTSETVTIGFIKLGTNRGLVESEFSDGTISYTVTDGAEVGVEGGLGGELDIGKLQAGASVDFGGSLELGYGSTWTVKDDAEGKELLKTIKSWISYSDAMAHNPSPVPLIWTQEPPPPPTETVRSLKVEAEAAGSVGLTLPWGDEKPSTSSKARSAGGGSGSGSGGGSGDGSGDGSGGKGDGDGSGSASLGTLGVQFGGSHKWTQITNTEDGSKTYTTDGELSAEASASTGAASADVKSLLGSSLSITRDAENQITAVEMTSTKTGKATVGDSDQPDLDGDATPPSDAGDVTVATSHLDVTTPEQRATVERWLQLQGSDQAAVSPDTLYPKSLVEGDDFQNLMYTQAVVSNVVYKVEEKDQQSFAAEVKVGVAFGVEFSSSTKDTYAVDASYLGWGDGQERQPVDYPECIAR